MEVEEEKSTDPEPIDIDSPQQGCTGFSPSVVDDKKESIELAEMEVDTPLQGSTGFSPCAVDNTEQYHGSGMAERSASPQKVSHDNTSSCVDLW